MNFWGLWKSNLSIIKNILMNLAFYFKVINYFNANKAKLQLNIVLSCPFWEISKC